MLIKAMTMAIPTYSMRCFKLSKCFYDELERMMVSFWWNQQKDERKLYWVNWKHMCKEKREGETGFKDLKIHNEALLAKQSWQIVNEPNSLLRRLLKAHCFPKTCFLKSKLGHAPS